MKFQFIILGGSVILLGFLDRRQRGYRRLCNDIKNSECTLCGLVAFSVLVFFDYSNNIQIEVLQNKPYELKVYLILIPRHSSPWHTKLPLPHRQHFKEGNIIPEKHVH